MEPNFTVLALLLYLMNITKRSYFWKGEGREDQRHIKVAEHSFAGGRR